MIPDVLAYNLKLLICGSALGNESYRQKAYYAHPANRFWHNLYLTGITPYQIEAKDYADVIKFSIGITDLCKTEKGLDSQLSKTAYDSKRLLGLVQTYRPKALTFSALKPARTFLNSEFHIPKTKIEPGWQPCSIGKTKIFVCTSTSPLYPYQDRTLDLWCQLASHIATV